MAKKANTKKWILMASALFAVLALLFLWKTNILNRWTHRQKIGPEEVIQNYGKEIYAEAVRLDVNAEYFMALCMLECGGRKPAPSRFEKHIFNRLKNVKAGNAGNYEHVTQNNLKNAGGSAIKNLASSWGPFQIMGYKVVQEGILVKDLRGAKAVEHGMRWITKEYGHLLRKNRFSDAFHYHNAGRTIPKNGKVQTYSKNYVKDGRKWMKYFKEKRDE